MLSITHALQDAARAFVHSETARLDAQVLLCHVLDKPTSYLYTWPDKILTDEEQTQFSALVARRIAGEPIAYIVGYRDFWSLRLRTSPATLIPRPDTELLVELVLSHLPSAPCQLLDLGTGTGAIALSVASERPDCHVFGVDYQQDAVLLALENQRENQITNADFIQSDWFSAIKAQQFAVIVSNPPYIDATDPHLQRGDVRFEPASALIADANGLADIRHICQQSVKYLEISGWLFIEHGASQGQAVRDIFHGAGFSQIATKRDYNGLERVTLGQFIAI